MKRKLLSIAFAITILSPILAPIAEAASEWGPTDSEPHASGFLSSAAAPEFPTFNNIRDINAGPFADQREFLVVKKTDCALGLDCYEADDELEVNIGDTLRFITLVSNNGKDSSGDQANNTKLRLNTFNGGDIVFTQQGSDMVSAPFSGTEKIRTTISSDNTKDNLGASVPEYFDETELTYSGAGKVRLRFKDGTSNLFLEHPNSGQPDLYVNNSTDIQNFFQTGLLVGSNGTNGATLDGNFEANGTNTIYAYIENIEVESADTDISLTSKTESKNNIIVGETTVITLQYNNNGPLDATNVVITDKYDSTLFDTTKFSSASGCTTDTSGNVTCNIGNVANGTIGATATYTIEAKAAGEASGEEAGITTDMGDTDTENNTATNNNITITDTPEADPTHDIVINEINWKGTATNSGDEWIELRNMTSNTIDLSGYVIWKHTAGGGTTAAKITSGNIAPYGFFLIADQAAVDGANTAITVTPDHKEDIALSNSTFQLKLYDGDPDLGATLLDVAGDKGTPFAGDEGISMARKYNVVDGKSSEDWFSSQISKNLTSGAGSPGNTTSSFADAFPETVYEDGEDGSTTGWSILRNAGGSINNNLGEITFSRDGGFGNLYYFNPSNEMNASDQDILQFDMFSSIESEYYHYDFIIYVSVLTNTNQTRYLSYHSVNTADYNKGSYRLISLGEYANNDEKYTFTRDLNADIQDILPGDSVKKVRNIRIRSTGKIDNIKLLSEMPVLQTISGSVKDGGVGIPNARVRFSGTGRIAPDVLTDENGNYTQTGFTNGDFTIKATSNIYNISPSEQDINLTGANGVVNFAASPLSVSVNYNNGQITSPYGTQGKSTEWTAYDNRTGGTILETINESGDNVIQIISNNDSSTNGFLLRHSDGSYLNITELTQLSFDAKGIDGLDADTNNDWFGLFVHVSTTKGNRYLYYSTQDTDRGIIKSGNTYYVHYGIGSSVTADGLWHNVSRNLQDDINNNSPSGEAETITKINFISVRGTARLDDVTFSN